YRRAGAGAARAGGARPRRVRAALSAPAVGRPAAAGGGGAGPRRRPPAAAPRRTVRRARPRHPRRAAARVPRPRRTPGQGDRVRHPRRARRTVARDAHRADARGPAGVPRHAATVPRVGPAGVPGVPRRDGGGVNLAAFYARNGREVLGLVGQHLYLVAVSTAVAILIGVLIPLPFIGGIGARTALVALVVYALLPIVRNTYAGIAGVDPAIRDAGRGMGMTDWQLLVLVELPLGLGVILAGVRVATVVAVGTATIAAA